MRSARRITTAQEAPFIGCLFAYTGVNMRSRCWRCPDDGYMRLTPTPTEPIPCPICRGRLIEGMPPATVELMPMRHGDALRYLDRVMREEPVGR